MMSIPSGWNSAGRAQHCIQITAKTVRAQACAVAPQAECLNKMPSVAVQQAQYAGERCWPTVQVPVQSAGRPESCPLVMQCACQSSHCSVPLCMCTHPVTTNIRHHPVQWSFLLAPGGNFRNPP
eukprot:gene9917-biopygen16758